MKDNKWDGERMHPNRTEIINKILQSHGIDLDRPRESWEMGWKAKVKQFCYNQYKPRKTPQDLDYQEFLETENARLRAELARIKEQPLCQCCLQHCRDTCQG